ncbi:MAG: hypothetical protein ACRDE2_05685 [Chitinophagaceae bacterium]
MKALWYLILESLVVALYFSLNALPLHAQLKVGNRPASQHKAAVLELESGSQGLLLTRVPDTSVMTGLNPPDGMIIYFTDGKIAEPFGKNAGIYERRGYKWKRSGIVIDTAVDQSPSSIKFTYNNDTLVLHLPNASSSIRGVMSTGKQTFDGKKTFKRSITLESLHPGSVLFIGKDKDGSTDTISENNSKLFWNDVIERLGIGTNTPYANLDVKGTFKLGEKGSVLNNIIRDSLVTSSLLSLDSGYGHLYSFPYANVKAGANVMVSPQNVLPDGCIIAYGYSTAGNIYIRIESIKDISIPANFKFYVTVIQ